MRQSGKTIANTQYITGIDVSNNLQDLIKANLVTTGDMDTVTIDASGDGTVSPGSLYVANSLQELFDAGQHVSVFSQVTYGDAAEMEAGSNEAAGTAGVNKSPDSRFFQNYGYQFSSGAVGGDNWNSVTQKVLPHPGFGQEALFHLL
mgnify:CR=1 FL=1